MKIVKIFDRNSDLQRFSTNKRINQYKVLNRMEANCVMAIPNAPYAIIVNFQNMYELLECLQIDFVINLGNRFF